MTWFAGFVGLIALALGISDAVAGNWPMAIANGVVAGLCFYSTYRGAGGDCIPPDDRYVPPATSAHNRADCPICKELGIE